MGRMLTDLADVLRAAGLDVVEMAGWKTRGRPGDFAPIGVLCHHTGSADKGLAAEAGYAKWLATVGREDLPAPLAQLALGRGGTFYVLAAGRANHAGKTRAIAGIQAGDGNTQLIGIEAMHNGTEPWSTAQYRAYTRGCAALNAHYGFPTRNTLGHKETSLSGKWDPGGIEMSSFRTDVANVDLQEEDEMPTLNEIAGAVWAASFGGGPDGQRETAGQRLQRAAATATAAARDAAVARALAEAAATTPDTLTPEEVDAIGERVGAEFDERFTVLVAPADPDGIAAGENPA